MYQSSKVTDKKQVTLPNYVMDALNLKPTDKVEFLLDDSTSADPVVRVKKVRDFFEYAGSIKTAKDYENKSDDEEVKDYFKKNYYNDRLNS